MFDEVDRPFSLKQEFPLHFLAKIGDHFELKNFIELDPVTSIKQISRLDFQGRSILHYCAMGVNLKGGQECVELIIKVLNELKGEDREMFLSTGFRRLTNRIRKHHWNGMDSQETINFINLTDINGESALHIAANNENTNIIQTLLMHSADVLTVSKKGVQVLRLIYSKTPSAVSALLDRSVYFDYGVDLDSFNNTERSYCLDFTAVIGDTTDCIKRQSNSSTNEDESNLNGEKQITKGIVYEEAYCLYKVDVDDSNADIYKGILTHPLVRFFVEVKIRKLRWIILTAIVLKLNWVFLYIYHIVEIYYNCCELDSITSQLSGNQSVTCSEFPFDLQSIKSSKIIWTKDDQELAYNTVIQCTKDHDYLGRSLPVAVLTGYVLLTIIFKFTILTVEYLKIQNCFVWIFTVVLMITLYPIEQYFKLQFQFASFGILLGTLVVLELIHKHIYWAIYIRVLITVIRRFLATFPLFFFVMIGFSVSMRMMYPNINPPIKDFRDALMEVFAAIANGKVEWTEGRKYRHGVDENFETAGFIMFIMFYVTMVLLLFRVLIGFVVADTKKIQEREELNEISQDLKEIFLFESITASRGFQYLSSFKTLRCLRIIRNRFMMCPKSKMKIWIKESEIQPPHLRKLMRLLASKNPPKFKRDSTTTRNFRGIHNEYKNISNGINLNYEFVKSESEETRF